MSAERRSVERFLSDRTPAVMDWREEVRVDSPGVERVRCRSSSPVSSTGTVSSARERFWPGSIASAAVRASAAAAAGAGGAGLAA